MDSSVYNSGYYNAGYNPTTVGQEIYVPIYQMPYVETDKPTSTDISTNEVMVNQVIQKGPEVPTKSKDFAALLITRELKPKGQPIFKICTFNPIIVKEWTEHSQIPSYVASLYKNTSEGFRVVNGVNAVAIARDYDFGMGDTEKGESKLTWKELTGNVIVKATSHVW